VYSNDCGIRSSLNTREWVEAIFPIGQSQESHYRSRPSILWSRCAVRFSAILNRTVREWLVCIAVCSVLQNSGVTIKVVHLRRVFVNYEPHNIIHFRSGEQRRPFSYDHEPRASTCLQDNTVTNILYS